MMRCIADWCFTFYDCLHRSRLGPPWGLPKCEVHSRTLAAQLPLISVAGPMVPTLQLDDQSGANANGV